MSQKSEKPTLSGQRIKTRKRDEKEKYDPSGFRDAILQGFSECGASITRNNNNGTTGYTNEEILQRLESVSKFLDVAGNKLDYRRYGEELFDILIAGGILAPGGSILNGSEPTSHTDLCIFAAPEEDQILKAYAQLIVKILRRYKYFELTIEEEWKKVLIFLKAFSVEERRKLAAVTAYLIAGGHLSLQVLSSALQDHQVKEGIALQFLTSTLKTLLVEKDPSTLWSMLRKAQLDNRLGDFFPVSRRTEDYMSNAFNEAGISALLEFQRAQMSHSVKKELQQQMTEQLSQGAPARDVIRFVREYQAKYQLTEQELVVLSWTALMAAPEWNKKEDLVSEQVIKFLKQYSTLLHEFATSARSELALLLRIQEFCYDNMLFMKSFQKIVVLLYKRDVLSEDTIMQWFKASHSSKGKSIFLEQMKRFVEWLQQAEEESGPDE